MSEEALPVYQVRAAKTLPELGARWDDPAWASANIVEITHFRPESTDHRPRARARLLHAQDSIRGIFHIDDKYVRSVRTGFQAMVCNDSCVEFFMLPRPDKGYFNLEMNAGASHLCYYVADPTRTATAFKRYETLPPEDGAQFKIQSTLPPTIEPEIIEPLSWEVNFFVPSAVLEKYTGPLGKLSGQEWRGNFYKCGNETSHPHWAAWAPVDKLNFHLPHCFGKIQFE